MKALENCYLSLSDDDTKLKGSELILIPMLAKPSTAHTWNTKLKLFQISSRQLGKLSLILYLKNIILYPYCRCIVSIA